MTNFNATEYLAASRYLDDHVKHPDDATVWCANNLIGQRLVASLNDEGGIKRFLDMATVEMATAHDMEITGSDRLPQFYVDKVNEMAAWVLAGQELSEDFWIMAGRGLEVLEEFIEANS